MDNLFEPCMNCSSPDDCAVFGCWSEHEDYDDDGEDTPVSASDGDGGVDK